MGGSVFLEVPESEWCASNDLAFAFRDRFPVSPGHTLVVTRRLVSDWFAASEAERNGVMGLVAAVKLQLDEELKPAGYNVGFNAGLAAGQTVMHLHVHVIPRFEGDMDDPRGGVRHVIPTKGNYRRQVKPLSSGGMEDPFSKHIFPLFNTASEIAIVAAFVQETGLDHIETHVRAAVARGARVRILTGNYLDITQASALEMLLAWETISTARDDDDTEPRTPAGAFEARIIEVERLPGLTRAFHPKAWRFEASNFGVAFVGSSNLSRSALETGIEWNLRVERDRDHDAYTRVREAFELLWSGARRLDAKWIEDYAKRARLKQLALPPGESDLDPLEPAPAPHLVQVEALAKLREAREQGWRRALVVLATGLGKTWLAAFDHEQLRAEIGRPPRLLFLAHRKELLVQAENTYRRALHSKGLRASVGWCSGDAFDLDAELVFASVAKLSRPENLRQLAEQRFDFDYVVVDEVHHAAANSYRRILKELEPKFILGLTATPDRADAADILGLFDDHIAYRADVERGVELGRLVPFRYFGVKDDIDYANIPWRNRRFDPDELSRQVQTESRMQTMWRAWAAHPGQRTLVFCCSIAHALFVRAWLTAQGVRTRAVYSGEGSDDRDAAIGELMAGEIDALCSVDVFNEGVDVPGVDRVVMLRPTESGVIFLQQLGRGLRAAPGKTAVTVIDFVGNHRIFLERLRALLSLGGASVQNLRPLLESREPLELPSGCSVELVLEAKDLLSRLFTRTGADPIEYMYRELRTQRGERPSAGELERLCYPPSRIRRHRPGFGWFDFVEAEGDLTPQETTVVSTHAWFLRHLESTEMSGCFEMVALEALLDASALSEGILLDDLATRALAIFGRSPDIRSEADAVFADGAPLHRPAAIRDRLTTALAPLTRENRTGRAWFKIEGEHFLPRFVIAPEDEDCLTELVRELIDLRLAEYRKRKDGGDASFDGFVCRVIWNQRDPILKLPARVGQNLPTGEVDVRVDGAVWQFRFANIACNVARPAGTIANQLPDLLRRWFGLDAGRPGTAFEVRFERSPDGLWATPVRRDVVDLAQFRGVVTYPDLRAAAGHVREGGETTERALVMLPVDNADPDLFAVRVSGTSMDGGKNPLRDGDWAVMRHARSAAASALENRVVLIQVPTASTDSQYQIKRLKRADSRWLLTSDNPAGPTFETGGETVAVARLERAIRPEELAPALGTLISEDALPTTFGLVSLDPKSGRSGGHLFVFIDQKKLLERPDRVRFMPEPQRPGETAFVLARKSTGAWKYLGVGRWLEEESRWQIPEVDLGTWREWGEGREVSRELPEGALQRAQLVVDAVIGLATEQRWLTQDNGRRARILGAADQGGLRIDGGEAGFGPRTVSLTDLAWVVVADDAARQSRAVLDEALVNRARYLEGTPRESTRWIDTAWALAAWKLGKGLVRNGGGGATPLRNVRGLDDRPLNASFRVEPVGENLSIVFESRGGTRGTAAERNTDYAKALGVMLERLRARGIGITDAFVESRGTTTVPVEDRRLQMADFPYPITIEDAQTLRRAMSAAQASIGRQPGARGSGNSTKRIRLVLQADGLAPDEIVQLLGAN